MNKCCPNCFKDSYIIGIINSSLEVGNCSYCTGKEVPLFPPSDLLPEFNNIFDLYSEAEAGEMLFDSINREFPILFQEGVNGQRLLQDMCNGETDRERLFRGVVELDFEEEATHHKNRWRLIADEIKNKNRFHIENTIDLEALRNVFSFYEASYDSRSIFFRARISNGSIYSREEMGAPPANESKNGRMNPIGIPYLYLSDSLETALYETRALVHDDISIVECRPKDTIKILKLRNTQNVSPFVMEDGFNGLQNFVMYKRIVGSIEEELKKPKKRYSSEIEYLPTQYISEYIKLCGYDGIEYGSSLSKTGYNLAIFDESIFEKIGDVYQVKVEEIKFKYQKIL